MCMCTRPRLRTQPRSRTCSRLSAHVDTWACICVQARATPKARAHRSVAHHSERSVCCSSLCARCAPRATHYSRVSNSSTHQHVSVAARETPPACTNSEPRPNIGQPEVHTETRNAASGAMSDRSVPCGARSVCIFFLGTAVGSLPPRRWKGTQTSKHGQTAAVSMRSSLCACMCMRGYEPRSHMHACICECSESAPAHMHI